MRRRGEKDNRDLLPTKKKREKKELKFSDLACEPRK